MADNYKPLFLNETGQAIVEAIQNVSLKPATDAQVNQGVANWLNSHPEATTTVQNGSITEAKLTNAVKEKLAVPDEEDLTKDNGKLMLKDRTSANGLGYVILRKGTALSEQIASQNTIYEVRYNFNLNGTSLTLPSGSVIKFCGGKLMNGSIVGNHSSVSVDGSYEVFDNVLLTGTFDGYVSDLWFKYSSSIAEKVLASLFTFNEVNFKRKEYFIDSWTGICKFTNTSIRIYGNGVKWYLPTDKGDTETYQWGVKYKTFSLVTSIESDSVHVEGIDIHDYNEEIGTSGYGWKESIGHVNYSVFQGLAKKFTCERCSYEGQGIFWKNYTDSKDYDSVIFKDVTIHSGVFAIEIGQVGGGSLRDVIFDNVTIKPRSPFLSTFVGQLSIVGKTSENEPTTSNVVIRSCNLLWYGNLEIVSRSLSITNSIIAGGVSSAGPIENVILFGNKFYLSEELGVGQTDQQSKFFFSKADVNNNTFIFNGKRLDYAGKWNFHNNTIIRKSGITFVASSQYSGIIGMAMSMSNNVLVNTDESDVRFDEPYVFGVREEFKNSYGIGINNTYSGWNDDKVTNVEITMTKDDEGYTNTAGEQQIVPSASYTEKVLTVGVVCKYIASGATTGNICSFTSNGHSYIIRYGYGAIGVKVDDADVITGIQNPTDKDLRLWITFDLSTDGKLRILVFDDKKLVKYKIIDSSVSSWNVNDGFKFEHVGRVRIKELGVKRGGYILGF